MANNKKKKREHVNIIGVIVVFFLVLILVVGLRVFRAVKGDIFGILGIGTGTTTESPKEEKKDSSDESGTAPAKNADAEKPEETGPSETAEEPAGPDLDDEYLVLVNKTHSVGSDYKPDDLVTVERFVQGVGNDETHKMRAVAAEAVNKMFDAAAAAGYDMRIRTAYRSYDYQTSLFNNYAANHGEAEANKYSARAGESEHQTGLAADITGKSVDYTLSYNYGNTDEGKWLYDHCHEFGFIVRYIDGTKEEIGKYTGYIYEPWHVRYVGVDAAKEIYDKGITLEEYLGMTD